MVVMFGNTVAVIGREPEPRDGQFVALVKHLSDEFTKAGRPLSGSEK